MEFLELKVGLYDVNFEIFIDNCFITSEFYKDYNKMQHLLFDISKYQSTKAHAIAKYAQSPSPTIN